MTLDLSVTEIWQIAGIIGDKVSQDLPIPKKLLNLDYAHEQKLTCHN